MLVVKNLSKQYGEFLALEHVNIEFDHGVYGLLAPNGAGKTTLIKMLVSLISPTKGEILYNGANIMDLDEEYRDILGLSSATIWLLQKLFTATIFTISCYSKGNRGKIGPYKNRGFAPKSSFK